MKRPFRTGFGVALGVLAASVGAQQPQRPPQNPPPSDPSWRLLSDNLQETEPSIGTEVVYVYDPPPEAADITIAAYRVESQGGTVDRNDPGNFGRRLLDNGTMGGWLSAVSWTARRTPVSVTFQFKKTYEICRVDALLPTLDLAGAPAEESAQKESIARLNPERIAWELKAKADKDSVEGWRAVGESEFGPEEIPGWVSSNFAPQPARQVRLLLTSKHDQVMSLQEVRIWGREHDEQKRLPNERTKEGR